MTVTCDVIGIVVGDMTATVSFYRDLGLAVPEGAESELHVEVPLGNGTKLAFDTESVIASFDDGFEPPTGKGRVGLAFRVETPAQVDETYRRMTAAGHQRHLEPWDAFWGQRYATLIDPNGVSVDLYCPLA